MKNFLIDTDILSYYLKGNETVKSNIISHLKNKTDKKLIFSEISYFEIMAALEYRKAFVQIDKFKEFASNSKILKISTPSIHKSAYFYGYLKRKGIAISTPDLLIAGIAFVNNLILVTNNQKHFKPIIEPSTTNWNKY